MRYRQLRSPFSGCKRLRPKSKQRVELALHSRLAPLLRAQSIDVFGAVDGKAAHSFRGAHGRPIFYATGETSQMAFTLTVKL